MSKVAVHKRVVISGGGTGGHLYPGLAVAEQFRYGEDDVLYLGSPRGIEAEVVPLQGIAFFAVPSRGISGSPFNKIVAVLALGVATLKAYWRLRQWQPNLVVGTGGFVCVPAVVAAKLLGVPVVVLEQNVVPGKATKLLSKFSDAVCISFKESTGYFPKERTVWTGNPLRKSIFPLEKNEACRRLGIDAGRPTLLVVGASQGAASINEAILKALPEWKDNCWNIVHLTGRNHLARVLARVESILGEGVSLTYQAHGFYKDMETLYSAADLVVSRAGATSIAEMTTLGLPSILVPYPYAGGHQLANAKVIAERGAARLIEDAELGNRLRYEVEALLVDKHILSEMSTKSKTCSQPQAAENVFEVCCKVMK